MPIKLNLLAEEKLAEEMRRRDPVKRIAFFAVLVIAIELFVVGLRQLTIITKQRELRNLQFTITTQTNTYTQILAAERKLNETTVKLAVLAKLCTNRFLWGSFLNALQKSMVSGIQLLELKGDQSYTLTEEIKPRTEGGRTIPGKPATAIERTTIILRAKDETEGENIVGFIASLQENSYLKQLLGPGNKIQLRDTSPPAEDPETKKRSVVFALEIRLPERVRQ